MSHKSFSQILNFFSTDNALVGHHMTDIEWYVSVWLASLCVSHYFEWSWMHCSLNLQKEQQVHAFNTYSEPIPNIITTRPEFTKVPYFHSLYPGDRRSHAHHVYVYIYV